MENVSLTILNNYLEKLYKKYKFVYTNKSDFLAVVKDEVEEIKKFLKTYDDQSESVFQKFSLSLEEIVKNDLKENFNLKSLSFLFQKNLHLTNNYAQIMSELNSIFSFLGSISFSITYDDAMDLLRENFILAQVFGEVVKKNLEKIQTNQIDSFFENEIMITFVEAYCMLHSIEVQDVDYSKFDFSSLGEVDDSLKMYILEVISYPLLSHDEEIFLGYKILEGDEDAKKILIERNLRLVIYYANFKTGVGVPLLDLIQEGNLGLMKAVQNFDVTRGIHFSTYASGWIRSFIRRAIVNTGRSLRLPEHYYDKLLRYKKNKAQLEMKFGRELSEEELSKQMGLSVKTIHDYEKYGQDGVSLDKLIPGLDDFDLTLKDIIPSSSDTEELSLLHNMQEQVRKLIQEGNLTPIEKEVLLYRNGFIDGRIWSSPALAERFHVRHQRIDQIEAKAIGKLRMCKDTIHYAHYLDDVEVSQQNLLEFQKVISSQPKSFISYYKKIGASREEKLSDMKVLPSLSEYLNSSSEIIENAFSKLTLEEKNLLLCKWCNGFENETTTSNYGRVFNKRIRNILITLKSAISNPDFKRLKKCVDANIIRDREILEKVKNSLESQKHVSDDLLALKKEK